MSALTVLELLAVPKDIEQQAKMDIAMKMMEAAAAQPQSAFTNFAALGANDAAGPADPSVLFSQALSHPEVKKKATEDISKIVQTMQEIFELFHDTYEQLQSADIEFGITYMTGQKTPLWEKWEGIWALLEQAYRGSFEIAPRAVKIIKKVGDILGNAETTKKGDIKARLKSFLEELKSEEEEALKVKSDFQNVVDRIRTFWADVEIVMKHPWCQLVGDYVFKSLDSHVAELSKQIAALQLKVAGLQSVLVKEVSVGSVAAALSIFQLCPSAFFDVMMRTYGTEGAGKALLEAKTQKDAAEGNFERTRAELNEAIATQNVINSFWSVLRQPKSHLESIAVKVDMVVNIWQTINLDMHALHEDLSNNVGDDKPLTKFFAQKLLVSKSIYGELAWMLEVYVEKMDL